MDADLFLQQFGHLAQGEGGIKKLRDVILQLAVRGKLVEQNPADEPAEVLLKKIEAERKKLAKAGKIKTPKLTPTISPTETMFELPNNWAWTRLGNIGSIFNGDSISASEKEREYTKKIEGYNYIATKDVGFLSRKINYDNGIKIPFDNKGFKVAHKDAVLICAEGGSAGKKIAIAEEDICFGNKLYAIETFSGLLPRYLFYVYQSPYFYKEFSFTTTGIIGGTSINKFNQIPVPIPPFEEQKRIVAKVDQLMLLCDKLEAEQNAQRTLKTQAVQSTLYRLTSNENTVDFGNSLNILERTFGNWFDDIATVKHLRANILQLAVQGKLVPQNHTDEPASELLKRIEGEKKRLVKEGKIRSSKYPAATIDKELPFSIPKNWTWTELHNVTKLITDGKHGDCNNLPNSGYYFLSAKDIQSGKLLYHNARQIVPSEFLEVHQRTNLEPGDICMVNTGATVGKIAIAEDNQYTRKTTFQKSVAVIKVFNEYIERRFIRDFLVAETPNLIKKSGGSAINNLLLGDLKSKLFPLPPLAEQKRIVAKVDELMTLCDQLEAHITHTQTLNTHLMDSLIHRMTEAA